MPTKAALRERAPRFRIDSEVAMELLINPGEGLFTSDALRRYVREALSLMGAVSAECSM